MLVRPGRLGRLGKLKRKRGGPPPTWDVYTGANNAAPVDLIPEYQRSGCCVSISDTQALVVQGEGPAGDVDVVSRVVTRGPGGLTLGDPVVLIEGLASGIYGLAKGDRLSPTRYITIGTVSAQGSAEKVFLLDETGAKIDEADIPGVAGYSYHDITAHSATKGVVAYSDQNNSNHAYLVGVDFTGDSISFGTPVKFNASISKPMAVAALTDTLGHVVHKNRVYRYTLSGTAVTVGNSVKQDASKGDAALDDTKEILRIDDTHSLVFTAWDADGRTPYAQVITDGTTPSAGTEIKLDTVKPAGLWQAMGDPVNAENTQFIFIWGRGDVSDKTAQSVVVYVGESYGLSVSDTVQLSDNIFADHTVGCSFGTSGYALAFWQDEDDNQAMGSVLLSGG